jgi:23S rRNA (cytosine1962-C5)-methyltransferase
MRSMSRPSELRVRLRKPLERSVLSGHPWLYRDALVPFTAEPGTVVGVEGKAGRLLARGVTDGGAIAVRIFTTEDEPLDARFFARRLHAATSLRERVVPAATSAYRLVHGEGDRLPGIVCDRYDSFAVLKLDGEGPEAWRERLVQWLQEPLAQLGVRGLLVRGRRKREQPVELAWGEAAPDRLVVEEHGMRLGVDLWHGQKTGLFLDHRESRHRVRALARGLRVLNLYGYTGGFSIAAGLGGATQVVTVDSAPGAIELAEESWRHNDLPADLHRPRCEDVPTAMAQLAAERAQFGLIVSDPPSFAPNAAAKQPALESYAALHHSALQRLDAGGYYLAASCSSHITRDDFDASLREGARRARRVVQVLERWSAPADHPRLLAFPEGDYLKVVLLRAI